MKTDHTGMNSRRVSWTLLSIAIFAGALLLFSRQRQHLSALRSEIAEKKTELAANGRDSQSQRNPVHDRNRPAQAGKEGLTDDGEADLPAAGALMAKITELTKGKTRREYAAMADSPELDKLRWLFADMGGKTFLKLMEGRELLLLSDAPGKDIFQKMFEEMNPQQALEILLGYPVADRNKIGIAADFLHWSELAPEAALQWFHKKEEQGDLVVKEEEVQMWAMQAEAPIHPTAVVGRMLQMEFSSGTQVTLNVICDGVKDPAERLAFLAAIDAAQTDGSHEREARLLREMFIKSIKQDLSEQPYAEASKVVDGACTPAEKVNFANSLSEDLDSRVSPDEWKRWSQWMAGLDAPVDEKHPLMKLMFNRFNPAVGEAAWVGDIPPGALRDLVVSKYVATKASPETAVKLIPLLPEGQERSDLARTVRSRAGNTDAAAVKSLQELEGAGKR